MTSCSHSRRIAFYSVLIALAAVLLRYFILSPDSRDIKQVIEALQSLEASSRPLPQPRPGPLVLVGFGACADVLINAQEFFDRLELSSRFTPFTKHDSPSVTELNSLEDIVNEFSRMFVSGAAAERYVKNQTLFQQLIAVADAGSRGNPGLAPSVASWRSSHLNRSSNAVWSLGGNAPVMASRLAREGARVALAARLSPNLRSALPRDVRVLSAPAGFGMSGLPNTDVHLVLEYSRGSVWRNMTAPRANRYILIRDQENPRLTGLWPGLLQEWDKAMFPTYSNSGPPEASRAPDLFVLGGLQTMDNAEVGVDVRNQRVAELKTFLEHQLPESTLVHFEMASFVENDFVANLTQAVMPYVDSVGANEQELPNLVSLLSRGVIAPHVSLSTPRAAVMLDAMREAWAVLTNPLLPRVGPGRRRFSRLHLHTLGYQAIMVRRPVNPTLARQRDEALVARGQLPPRPTETGRAWPFTRVAAAKASLIAHRHTCATSSIDQVRTRLLMDDSFASTADPSRWASALMPADSSTPPSKQAVRRIHFNSTAPVACWYEPEPELSFPDNQNDRRAYSAGVLETRVEICVAPVLVCLNVTRTAGGGDNISAGALHAQLVAR